MRDRSQPAIVRFNRIRGLLLLVLVLLTPVLAWNGFVQQMNVRAVDIFMRLRPPAVSGAIRQIVLLAIDDTTARRYGPLPLKRSLLAEGLTRLRSFQPRVVALDLLLSEEVDSHDLELASSVRQLRHAILGAAIQNDESISPIWILPIPALEHSATLGHLHAAPDADGTVRSVLLAKVADQRRLWALGLEAVAADISGERPLETERFIQIGPVRIPATQRDDRMMLINYAGPEGTFQRISFSTLLETAVAPKFFKDKIVILGVTAQGSGDRLSSPVSSGFGI